MLFLCFFDAVELEYIEPRNGLRSWFMDSQPKVAFSNPRVDGERLSATALLWNDLSKPLAVYTRTNRRKCCRAVKKPGWLVSYVPLARRIFCPDKLAKLLATIISAPNASSRDTTRSKLAFEVASAPPKHPCTPPQPASSKP